MAAFSASRLADAPLRGRLPGPDPVGALASLASLAVGLGAFLWLGRVARGGGSSGRAAVIAGALGGSIAGLGGGAAQAAAIAGYLGAALRRYAVPQELLAALLGAYVLGTLLAGAAAGAVTAYLAWRWSRAQPTG